MERMYFYRLHLIPDAKQESPLPRCTAPRDMDAETGECTRHAHYIVGCPDSKVEVFGVGRPEWVVMMLCTDHFLMILSRLLEMARQGEPEHHVANEEEGASEE